VVSFGVAPSLIIYQFLRLSFAQQDNGLDVNMIFLVPAFLVACAGAYRLARFNIDTEHTTYFKGLPIPANGLLVASFPLIYWTNNYGVVTDILISPWFWYALVLLLCYLMVSKKPMLALKFSNTTIKKLMPFIIIAVIALISAFFIQWLAVPLSFLVYVILSLLNKQSS
jgi:CDP-diacylglycerol--serine O-phosphatidyltransferase